MSLFKRLPARYGAQTLLLLCALLFTLPRLGAAEPEDTSGLRARLSQQASGSLSSIQFAPVNLAGGSRLTLISPLAFGAISNELAAELRNTHRRFSALFGDIPAFKSAVRLMDENSFFLVTGAPSWTNALFFRGEIVIPVDDPENVDMENIVRSLRHEYMHAVISVLSGGRCPGWLDEGLAQWAEGSENPALRPALAAWLDQKDPLPLQSMQGGFTRFEAAKVPVAYAQSLFAANTVINSFGFTELRKFFNHLRNGTPQKHSFEVAFGMSHGNFEAKLHSALREWQSQD
jgi:hypothetical protein